MAGFNLWPNQTQMRGVLITLAALFIIFRWTPARNLLTGENNGFLSGLFG